MLIAYSSDIFILYMHNVCSLHLLRIKTVFPTVKYINLFFFQKLY
ncbi:hypothetical protein A1OE_1450 [Candidatus Endolissoclinum faulkneri L2]|uniref:Uncharacterized protein n=1 Tax=Candidatus Endolissoclinum faulkneri L2 TaxID=1193729 RepID=K7YSS7_9PROT|nr:hypothetical protein A1OE_1450 [Candidatus Endolissoclinum faulkneri L2]